MFRILVPKNWVFDDGRLILRLVNRSTKEKISHRIIQGKAMSLKLSDLPSNSPGEVVVWIDVATANKTYPVTKRINLASLRKGSKLRDLIYNVSIREHRSSPEQSDIDLLNALRWIRPSGKDDSFRISHRVLNDFGSITKDSAKIIEECYLGMSNYQNINDGSEICNQISFMRTLCRIRTLAQERLTTKDAFSRQAVLSGNIEVQKFASELLEEARSYADLPAMKVVTACLESVLFPRHVSAASFESLREEKNISSIRQTGALAGVSSSGDLGLRNPINIPKVEYRGIGADLHSRKKSEKTTVIYSADPKFLKSYLLRLVFYISLFPEFDYHFHIVASDAEFTETSKLFLQTYELNQNIRGKSSATDHISFSSSEVPVDVVQENSYFASARYLIADQVMKITNSPVWIQDVDLFPTADPTGFEAALQRNDVTLYVSSFARGLFPWTRYLAGNVYINNSAMGEKFLLSASSYLSEWVSVPDSWTVDQNAITYALDNCGPELLLGDMKELKLPLTQSKLSVRIER